MAVESVYMFLFQGSDKQKWQCHEYVVSVLVGVSENGGTPKIDGFNRIFVAI